MIALLAGLAMPAMAEPVAPVAARFTDATDRYPHNVLGDLTGFGGLGATLSGGTTVWFVLPMSLHPMRFIEMVVLVIFDPLSRRLS